MASLVAVALLWAGNTFGAEQTPASAKTGALERITNERLYFSLSPDGRKFELGFVGEGPSISGERGLFDMMVGVGQRREWGIAPEEQTALVTREGRALVARYARLRHAGAEYKVQVELRFTLEGEGIVCEAKLDNQSDIVIEEFWFPWVGPFRSLGPDQASDTLLLPQGFGRRIENAANYVEAQHTLYIAPDQKRVLACSHYPGGTMTMNWFGLYGGGKAVGLLSEDPTFQTTGLNLARETSTGRLAHASAARPPRAVSIAKLTHLVFAKGYTAGRRAAIVAYAHTSREQPFAPKLKQPLRFLQGATVKGDFHPGDSLPAPEVAVLVYEQ